MCGFLSMSMIALRACEVCICLISLHVSLFQFLASIASSLVAHCAAQDAFTDKDLALLCAEIGARRHVRLPLNVNDCFGSLHTVMQMCTEAGDTRPLCAALH